MSEFDVIILPEFCSVVYITIIHLLFRITDRMGQSAMAIDEVDVASLPDSPTTLSCAGKVYIFVFWRGEAWKQLRLQWM